MNMNRNYKKVSLGKHRVCMKRTLDGAPWYTNYCTYTIWKVVGGRKDEIDKTFIRMVGGRLFVDLTADGYVGAVDFNQSWLDDEKKLRY